MPLEQELIAELKEAYDKVASGGAINKDTLGQVFKEAGEAIPAFKVRDIAEKHNKSGNEEITFDEFIQIFEGLNLAKSKGSQFKQNVQAKSGITQVSGYEQTSSGTVHSMSDAERTAFSNYINEELKNDADCKKYLPINPDSDDLFKKMGDGILLCKLVNVAVPGTIDERAINKTKINAFTSNENLVLALNSCVGIGCHVVNIDPNDIKEARIHLILGLMWQVIRIAIFQSINITKTPDLLCLLREGETAEQLLSLSPEELLIRWVNYQIEKVNCPKTLSNFATDLKDSVIYAALEDSIMQEHMIHSSAKINNESDQLKRAQYVLDNSHNAGIVKLITNRDIVSGSSKLNMVLVCAMFNKYPNLKQVEQVIIEETREEKNYRNWMNSMGVKPIVQFLYVDLSDGLVLLQLEDIIQPKIVTWDKVNNPPYKPNQAMLKKTENCNKVVEYAKQLNFSTVGLSGKDIAEGSKMHVLGLVWQLMSRYTLKMLQELSGSSKPMTDSEIVAWVNQKFTDNSVDMRISGFKDPLVINSLAILELINVIQPDSVDRSLIKTSDDDGDKLLNAKLAVSLARKIGGRVYALPEDIVEAKVKMIMTIFACLMITSFKANK